jgi:hypothetical protein
MTRTEPVSRAELVGGEFWSLREDRREDQRREKGEEAG